MFESEYYCYPAEVALLGSAAVFKIGRDDGGPFFVFGFIVASAVGVVPCIWAYFA